LFKEKEARKARSGTEHLLGGGVVLTKKKKKKTVGKEQLY